MPVSEYCARFRYFKREVYILYNLSDVAKSEVIELLVYHEIIKSSEKDSLQESVNFNEAVCYFQEKNGLVADSIVGSNTLWELQYSFVMDSPKLALIRVKADKINNIEGFGNFYLRQDLVSSYETIYNQVHNMGGVVTSSGSLRELSARVSQGRSAKSLHYTGLALDLSINSGFFSKNTDPYLISYHRKDTFWRIWCRSEKGEEMELESVSWEN